MFYAQVRTIFGATFQGFRYARGTLLLASAILMLAMSAAISTYSVVDAVALRSLPYSSPSRLIAIATPATTPGTFGGLSPADSFQLESAARSLSAIAASRPSPPIYLDGNGGRDPVAARLVTTNLFEVLGVGAVAGRLFSASDEQVSGLTPAVLTYEVWVARFGSDPNIVGQTINAEQQRIQIVGVLPSGVWYPMELPPPAIYIPYRATEADRTNNRSRSMSVVARLQSGITVAQARGDIARASTSPVVVLPLLERVVGPAKRWLYLVLAAVLFVLLIACVNVATLLLARAASRSREFALRASLGESRSSLTATLLLEGFALATVAGAAALAVSALGVDTVKAILPPGVLTRTTSIAINGRVALAALGMVTCAAAIFGSAPACLMRFTDLIGLMKSSGGPIAGGRQIDRTLARLLVAEVAVVSVLVVATTLVVRSFILITTADLGFDRQNVASIEFRRQAMGTDSQRRIAAATLRRQLLERVRAIPGVTSAAVSVNAPVPLAGASVRYSVEIPGYGETLKEDLLETRFVTAQYFDVMRMQLSGGRWFSDDDRLGSPAVVVINDVAARRFFRGRNPIGAMIGFRAPTTVIGVVRSVRHEGPEGNLRPEMYLPADQDTSRLPMDMGSIVFRTANSDRHIAEIVRDTVRPILGVDPDAPQFVDDYFRRVTAGRRFNATVMSGFGLVAIVLGLAGVYASMQFVVRRQYRDIGVRLALGAAPVRVMRDILGVAVQRITLGLLLGLALALSISSAFRSFVFGVTTTEPAVYLEVAAFIIAFGLTAALLPALHASRIDPAETLRRD